MWDKRQRPEFSSFLTQCASFAAQPSLHAPNLRRLCIHVNVGWRNRRAVNTIICDREVTPMSSVIANVVEIEAVQPHPNADRLFLARIKGWQAVIRKLEDGSPEFAPGERVVFIPPDS